ncbi:uncharacterized protein LOC143029034 [Oratosquilla oratoria]|uniref:uncharacterized protein LOC143029034 n=1 Tax=Oratosquilla oratoria TaxID=337810 RepID=UPI003F76B6C3
MPPKSPPLCLSSNSPKAHHFPLPSLILHGPPKPPPLWLSSNSPKLPLLRPPSPYLTSCCSRTPQPNVASPWQGWLRPGGKLLVTDYCRGSTTKNPSKEFLDYVKQRGYDLRTVTQYGEVLRGAGFKDVKAHDMTNNFVEILAKELKYFVPTREAFVKDFSETDYNDIVEGWKAKMVRCRAGNQSWGLFEATK